MIKWDTLELKRTTMPFKENKIPTILINTIGYSIPMILILTYGAPIIAALKRIPIAILLAFIGSLLMERDKEDDIPKSYYAIRVELDEPEFTEDFINKINENSKVLIPYRDTFEIPNYFIVYGWSVILYKDGKLCAYNFIPVNKYRELEDINHLHANLEDVIEYEVGVRKRYKEDNNIS